MLKVVNIKKENILDNLIKGPNDQRAKLAPSPGDVDENGVVDLYDTELLNQVIKYGDLDGNDILNNEDLYELFQEVISDDLSPDEEELDEEDFADEEPEHSFKPVVNKLGDINHDGKTDISDVQIIFNALKNADMNGDFVLDFDDLATIQEQIEIDPESIPSEENSSNNVLETSPEVCQKPESLLPVTINGDLNNNGWINREDLQLLDQIVTFGESTDDKVVSMNTLNDAFHAAVVNEGIYGSVSPAFVPTVDVNDDGNTDFADVMMIYNALKNADINNDEILDKNDIELLTEQIAA